MTRHGWYKTVRLVLDVSSWYYMVTEFYDCTSCRTGFAAWDSRLINQMDASIAYLFPAVMTYHHASDKKVMSLLRGRTQGNSPTALQQRLQELHSEDYLQRCGIYLDLCRQYAAVCRCFGKHVPKFEDPPPPLKTLHSARWLLSCYVRDVYSRLPLLHAAITSIGGSILKLDSTKKICNKLQGTAAGSAQWATNVSNERGEVLISVLTESESQVHLQPMVDGLTERFEQSKWDHPQVLYVDRDCCSTNGPSRYKELFNGWPNMMVRLDIWHIMRRLEACCVSKSHPLFGTFMARLSNCIFEWDGDDVALLHQAKQHELLLRGVPNVDDSIVKKSIRNDELHMHCRRRTRGAQRTTELIENLMRSLKSKTSLFGECLFVVNAEEIWQQQKQHMKCIQDPTGVALYTKIRTLHKVKANHCLRSFRQMIHKLMTALLKTNSHLTIL